MNKEKIREKEKTKYNKEYFENFYWAEDLPDKEHYKKFNYNDPTHNKRFLFLTNLLIKYFKFHTFLDAGCGMGYIIKNLLAKGYKCKGIEISRYAISHYLLSLYKRKLIFYAELKKLPFKNNEFDLVFCSDVMEHILSFDIKGSLKELARVTKKYLVFTINLDHPCKYHPTILSRQAWERLIRKNTSLRKLNKLEEKIQNECRKKYGEYEFFVYKK